MAYLTVILRHVSPSLWHQQSCLHPPLIGEEDAEPGVKRSYALRLATVKTTQQLALRAEMDIVASMFYVVTSEERAILSLSIIKEINTNTKLKAHC